MGDGAATSVAALFSALPNTTFGQNVGLVALTGVMSRHVVSICAGFLIALGLVPKLAAVITVMPAAVLGGAAVVMFGMLLGAGIQLLSECRLDRHDLIVIAASIGVGQGFAAVPAAAEVMPESLRVLMISGILPAAVIAVVLNLARPAPEVGAAFVDVDTALPETVRRSERE
jgi:xanthine/uracil permease